MLPFVLLVPALMIEVVVHLVPAISGILMSFRGGGLSAVADPAAAPWVGWENYRRALDSSGPLGTDLWTTVMRSVAFTGIVVAGSWVLGTGAALLLAGPVRGGTFFRALFLVPFAVPVYASVLGWRQLFARDNGMINHLLVDQFGLLSDRPFWLIGDNAFAAMILVAVWRLWPFIFLMILAAVQAVDPDLHEAAALDGASWLRRQWTVTRPAIGRVTLIVLAVSALWTFSDFGTPHLLFDGSPPPSALLLPSLIYRNAFGLFDLSIAAAVNSVVLAVMLLGCLVAILVGRRVGRHA